MVALKEIDDHRPIFQRVGLVLIGVGLVDIVLMVYCFTNHKGYSSCLNIFAVIAGIVLLNGSLKAARIVSLLAALFIATFTGVMLSLCWLFPLDLAVSYLRIRTLTTIVAISAAAALLIAVVWIYRTLTSPPIRIAMNRAEVNHTSFWRRPSLGFWVGSCLALFFLISESFLIDAEINQKARQRAAAQIGPGYNFHVTSLITPPDGKFGRALITAYNDKEIKDIVVEWEE